MSYSFLDWLEIWQIFIPRRLELLKTHHCALYLLMLLITIHLICFISNAIKKKINWYFFYPQHWPPLISDWKRTPYWSCTTPLLFSKPGLCMPDIWLKLYFSCSLKMKLVTNILDKFPLQTTRKSCWQPLCNKIQFPDYFYTSKTNWICPKNDLYPTQIFLDL